MTNPPLRRGKPAGGGKPGMSLQQERIMNTSPFLRILWKEYLRNGRFGFPWPRRSQ